MFEVCELEDDVVNVNIFVVDHKVLSSLLTTSCSSHVMYLLRYVLST